MLTERTLTLHENYPGRHARAKRRGRADGFGCGGVSAWVAGLQTNKKGPTLMKAAHNTHSGGLAWPKRARNRKRQSRPKEL